ncbi:hypothetical protein ACA910_000681 [Epithemia clementina (nom. ined.)]
MFKRLFRLSSSGKKKSHVLRDDIEVQPKKSDSKESTTIDDTTTEDVAELKIDSYRMQVVLKFLQNMNSQDLCIFDALSLRTRVIFESFSCNVAEYYDMMKLLFQSFPDFKFVVRGIEEEADRVMVKIQVRGTHTGVPYKATPETPAIPASGAFVQNDPEIFTCIFGEGGTSTRITEIQVKPFGKLSGPMGFYTQLEDHKRKSMSKKDKKQHVHQ